MKFKKVFASVMLLAAVMTLASCGARTVKFETNGGSNIESIETSGVLAKPIDPTKEGYTFKGWFKDVEFKEEFEFQNKISADITIYAKWEIRSYTVKFEIKDYAGIADANKPANPANATVEHGKAIAPINFVVPTGYSIAWFTDEGFTTAFVQATVMKADTTIYGKLSKNNYEVTFDLKGGTLYLLDGISKVEDLDGKVPFTYGQSIGDVITGKYLVEKTGFEAHYYSDAEYKIEIDQAFNTAINARNVTIYINWVKKEISAPTGEKKEYTFVAEDLNASITESKEFGDFMGMASAAKAIIVSANGKTNDGMEPFTHRLQLGGAGSVDFRSIQFMATGKGRLTVYCISSNSATARTAVLLTAEKNTIANPYLSSEEGEVPGLVLNSKGDQATYVLEMEIDIAGTFYFTSADGGLNVYKIQFQLY